MESTNMKSVSDYFIVPPKMRENPANYNDVIMSTLGSQITGVPIVCLTVDSVADQRNYQSSASLAFWWEPPVTDGFPSERASSAENVSIWWRHHAKYHADIEVSADRAHYDVLLCCIVFHGLYAERKSVKSRPSDAYMHQWANHHQFR